MHFYIKRFLRLRQIEKLGVVSFFVAFAGAIAGTVWSIYLNSYLENLSYVGFVSTFFTLVSLISCILLIPVVQRLSKTTLYLLSLILIFLSYLAFSLVNNFYLVLILGVVLYFSASLRLDVFGLIVADKSEKGDLSKNEGFIYTLTNLAWLIGPILAGFIADVYGVRGVFIMASFFMVLAAFSLKEFKVVDNKKDRKPVRDFLLLFKEYFSDKNRSITYLLGGGMTLWWAFIYTYGPIYILQQGLRAEFVGFFLFAIALPLVFLESYFGKIAGKVGFKKIFVAGYLIMSFSALLCFFTVNLYLMFGLILLASVGASMLEPTTEAYFMDVTGKKERGRFYGVYNTTMEVFASISTFVAGLILIAFDFKFLFLFYGGFLFLLMFCSLFVKNIVEIQRKSHGRK